MHSHSALRTLTSRNVNSYLFIALVVLIAGAMLLPTLKLVITSLSVDADTKQTVLFSALQKHATRQSVWHSFYTSSIATLISLCIGGLFATAITFSTIRGKKILVFGLMLPMMIPPQVTALAWIQLFGPASTLLKMLGIAPELGSTQPLYSPEGIALLLGIQHAPLVFLTLRTQLILIPASLIDAARLTGASQLSIMRTILFPLVKTSLIAAAMLAFISSLGNFGIPAMLGIPVSYYVLPTLIYQKMAGFGHSVLAEVSSLSVLMGGFVLLGLLAQQRLSKNSAYDLTSFHERPPQFHLGAWQIALNALLWLFVIIVLITPLIALISSSLVPALGVPLNAQTLSIEAYYEVMFRQQSTQRAFINSLMLAGILAIFLMCVSFMLAFILAKKPTLSLVMNTIIDMPYALPGTVLAIACILLFVKPIPILNINIYSTLSIIFIAYVFRFFAVALKPIAAGLSQLDSALDHAAQLAGASTLQRLRDIIVPLMLPAVFAGGILVFLIAVNELTVSALLWSAGNETIGVLIYNLEEGGDSVLAAAASVIVVVMVIVLMALLSLLAKRLPKGTIPWHI